MTIKTCSKCNQTLTTKNTTKIGRTVWDSVKNGVYVKYDILWLNCICKGTNTLKRAING